jgi:beta-fructofuranosidase
VDAAARIADFGKDNYACQFSMDIPRRNQVSIAWASNWECCNYVPAGLWEGWQSAMSLPWVNYLKNVSRIVWDLLSEPHNMSAVTPSKPIASSPDLGNGSVLATLDGTGSGVLMINASVTALNVSAISASESLNVTTPSFATEEMLTFGRFL